MSEDFGVRLRELRESQGIGLREFERVSGYARQSLWLIETGKRSASLKTLEAIVRKLGFEMVITFRKLS